MCITKGLKLGCGVRSAMTRVGTIAMLSLSVIKRELFGLLLIFGNYGRQVEVLIFSYACKWYVIILQKSDIELFTVCLWFLWHDRNKLVMEEIEFAAQPIHGVHDFD